MLRCMVVTAIVSVTLLTAGCGVPAEEHNRVQAQLKDMTQKNADLEAKVADLNAKAIDADSAGKSEKQRADGLQEQLAAMETKLNNTVSDLVNAQKLKDATTAALQEAQRQVDKLNAVQQDLAKAKKDIVDLTAQIAALNNEKAALQQAVDGAKKATETLRKKVEALGGDVSKYLDTIPVPETKTDQPQ